MIRAVLDASAVISGAGWGAESYHCLVAVAQRQTRSFATREIVDEWRETLKELEVKATRFSCNQGSIHIPDSPLAFSVYSVFLVVSIPCRSRLGFLPFSPGHQM